MSREVAQKRALNCRSIRLHGERLLHLAPPGARHTLCGAAMQASYLFTYKEMPFKTCVHCVKKWGSMRGED